MVRAGLARTTSDLRATGRPTAREPGHDPDRDPCHGAHAAVMGMTLLTRDASRYRAYFPTLELVAPA